MTRIHKAAHQPILCGPAGLRPSPRGVRHAASAAVQDVASTHSSGLAESVRHHFPILEQEVHGKPLVYLDSAATSQKPTQVLDVIREFNLRDTANVHRGVHELASRATDAYEGARGKLAAFINASSDREIVWTKNATEAINLVAQSWAMHNLKEGDEVVVSVAEHHANIVPWQIVCKAKGATLKHIGLTATQELDIDDLRSKVTDRTKLIALPHVSNMLGCVLPVAQVVEVAQQHGAKVLLDACQSVPHMPVDVQALGVDFIAASGHKMAGPSGVGFLWAKLDILESMPPWQFGGEMINQVHLDHSTFAPPPLRFEPGTPAIEQVVGLGAAVDYLNSIGMQKVHEFEMDLGSYMYEKLSQVDDVIIYGPPPDAALGRAGLASFNIEGLHATDVSMLLDAAGVAVRSGHHCAQPLHTVLGVNASARASLYIYNTRSDVDSFVEALKESAAFFKSLNA